MNKYIYIPIIHICCISINNPLITEKIIENS